MGWYLDGKVSAVVGTHTHVPTADAKILPRGTAFVTDLGMTGPVYSIIGSKVDDVLTRFLTAMAAPPYGGGRTRSGAAELGAYRRRRPYGTGDAYRASRRGD